MRAGFTGPLGRLAPPAGPLRFLNILDLRGRRRRETAMKLSSYQNLRVPNFSGHALHQILEDAGLDCGTALTNAEIDPHALNRPGGTIPAKKGWPFSFSSLPSPEAA